MIYSGEIENGQMHGRGTLIYPNKEKYEGDWVYGKRHGYGVYSYADSSKYDGEWVDDKWWARPTWGVPTLPAAAAYARPAFPWLRLPAPPRALTQ
eukprot:gene11274-2050_t